MSRPNDARTDPMYPAPLLHSTGHPDADRALEGLIGVYELAFPGRIRGYYLAGSYADGSPAPGASDIDLYVVFRGDLPPDEAERARQLRRCCERLCPLEIDAPPRGETDLRESALSIKCASVLVYGEDIRDGIALPDRETYVRHVTMAPVLHFSRTHGGPPLVVPVTHPDPDGEFFGYDDPAPEGADGPPWRNAKRLVHLIGWAATASVALATGRMVARKGEWLPAYREEIGDEWTPYLEDVYLRCKGQYRYRIREDDPEACGLFRELCRRAPEFQNAYLARYRDYLSACLRSGDEATRLFAERRAQDILFTVGIDETRTAPDETPGAVRPGP